MSKPTDGAMRAANAASHLARNAAEWRLFHRDELAEIIDRETDLPGLLAALLAISDMRACGDRALDSATLDGCATIARRALAKAKGG